MRGFHPKNMSANWIHHLSMTPGSMRNATALWKQKFSSIQTRHVSLSCALSGWLVSAFLYVRSRAEVAATSRPLLLSPLAALCPEPAELYISIHVRTRYFQAIFRFHTVIRMIFVIVRLFCWCYFPIPYVHCAHSENTTRSFSLPEYHLRDIHQHYREASKRDQRSQYLYFFFSLPCSNTRRVAFSLCCFQIPKRKKKPESAGVGAKTIFSLNTQLTCKKFFLSPSNVDKFAKIR